MRIDLLTLKLSIAVFEEQRPAPARPGVPQDFLDPITAMSSRFKLSIAIATADGR